MLSDLEASQDVRSIDVVQVADVLSHTVDAVTDSVDNAGDLCQFTADLVSSLAAFTEVMDLFSEVRPSLSLDESQSDHSQIHPFLRIAWGVASGLLKVRTGY